MKIIKNNIKALLFFSLAFMASCSKDDDLTPVTYADQNPLEAYLSSSGFNQQTLSAASISSCESGFTFIPKVTGKMKAITVRIPNTNPNLRITIWDKLAGTVLRTELVNVTTADVEVAKTITDLALVKDKEYMITFNTQALYFRSRSNGSNVAYPITSGDIIITSYGNSTGTAQVIPTTYPLHYYGGDISFVFQQTQ